VVATNQSGIGRGMIDMASFNAVHAHMMKLVSAVGGRIDAVVFCPHTPDEHCECRKPQPGMMLQIAKRWNVQLADVPMVGDSLRELEAARNAGCQPHLVRTGRASSVDASELERWHARIGGMQVHESLATFAEHLLALDPDELPSAPMPGP
jgi:D-glycero-D-manno-heptose 1,7-bisphosphate phosphatase